MSLVYTAIQILGREIDIVNIRSCGETGIVICAGGRGVKAHFFFFFFLDHEFVERLLSRWESSSLINRETA